MQLKAVPTAHVIAFGDGLPARCGAGHLLLVLLPLLLEPIRLLGHRLLRVARVLAAVAHADLAILLVELLVLDQDVARRASVVRWTRMEPLRATSEVCGSLRDSLLPSLKDQLLLHLARCALVALSVEGHPELVPIASLVLVLAAAAFLLLLLV